MARKSLFESIPFWDHLMIAKTYRTDYCKMEEKRRREELAKEIEALKEELMDQEKALPAHTIRPHQLLAIEELEEKIRRLEEILRTLS
jgi:hypothetical protein